MADREGTALPRPTFAALLESAVTMPGMISRAYSAFHSFSLGNQLLAAMQCAERRLPLGPLASFQAWKQKGRHVRRGERALWLWMPLTVKRTVTADDGTEATEAVTVTRFALKPHWFVYAQTEGRELAPAPIPEWDRGRALAALDVAEITFDLPDGNVQGFARGRSIAVSPVAAMPHKTTFHELGHVLLGHTAETVSDGATLPRSLREVEAECVALLCTESLGMAGAECCRGYVQHWLRGESIPEASAGRIFKAADAILRAGRAATVAEAA